MILRVGMGNLYLKQLRTNEPLVLRHVELLLADLEHQGNAELAVLVQAADQTSPRHVAIVEGLELIDVKALHVLSPRGMLNAHRPGTLIQGATRIVSHWKPSVIFFLVHITNEALLHGEIGTK